MKYFLPTLALVFGGVIGFWIGSHHKNGADSISAEKASIAQPPQNTISVQSSVASEKKETTQASVESRESAKTKSLNNLKQDFDQQLNQSDFDGAESALSELRRAGAHSLEYLESNSRLLVRRRNWQDAKESLTECLQLFPKSESCLEDMASTELQVGTKEEQEKAALNCLNNKPNDSQCRNMLAISKMNQGKYPEAVTIYRRLIKDNGNYGVRFDEAMLDWQLGVALDGAGNRAEAIIAFEKACRGNSAEACKKLEVIRSSN